MLRVRTLAAWVAGILTAFAGTPDSGEIRARQLLRTGQTALAERLVHAAQFSGPSDALLTLSGEIAFRRAAFDEASAAFTAALASNSGNARAHWGLGRIDQLHFRPESARRRFARAYSLDPRDTDIILSYCEFVNDPGARATLLRNVVALSWPADPDVAERAVAQLKILQRLQGRAPARLASPYAAYRLRLSGFHPVGAGQEGVILSARINGGKPLRLLLDTGARGVTIDAHSARNLNLEPLVASRLGGLGEAAAAGSHLALARTLAIGSLAFDECLVEVSAHSLTSGADGAIGIDLFERFRIVLNAAARTLELTPFEDSAPDLAGGVPALGLRHLLLLHTNLEGGKTGLFLLDTGAAFTGIARELVPAAGMHGSPVDLFGAQGPLSGALRIGPLGLSIGGQSKIDAAPLALDLRAVSQAEGIEISGILGYSLLSQAPLKIDLRHGLVNFGAR